MLILAGTPIGNLGDASARLLATLEAATVLAAEDTRVAHRLLAGLHILNRPRLVIVNEQTERGRAAELVHLAADGDLVLVTDAGMPTVSDPGYALVRACVDAGVTVSSVPGPSAVLTALAVSGLPTDRFVFDGFAPRRAGDRMRYLAAVAREPRTTVLFESPNRLAALLQAMAEAFDPQRRVVVCRELTKLYEEVRRGSAAELAEWAAGGVRGEIVVLVEGAPASVASLEDGLAAVQRLLATGTGMKQAAAEVAEATGLAKHDLYEAALAAKHR
ncbi:16S rRNA (cytidine(1402)-2'-O)-methyltransferase [uncultured Amnibacterium sp.]|uniref:16S rRNA (cytidine(1402)-2'-O)-methyltransferase n=1 Tax=uncultured Amnibacterium sp. TaxID=1631851 RepID=UPI0035CB75CE